MYIGPLASLGWLHAYDKIKWDILIQVYNKHEGFKFHFPTFH